MPDYPDNSDKYRSRSTLNGNVGAPAEEKKEDVVTPVVSKPAVVKKRGVFASFIKEDLSSVGRYILGDILMPALKKTVVDMICNGANKMFYGSAKQYTDYSDKSARTSIRAYNERTTMRRDPDSFYPYNDVIFPSAQEAEEARRRLRERIYRNGYVTVAYLYQLADWAYDPVARNYGWSNLDFAQIIPVKDGYWLKLPRAMEIIL